MSNLNKSSHKSLSAPFSHEDFVLFMTGGAVEGVIQQSTVMPAMAG
jgi:hypothetical protein